MKKLYRMLKPLANRYIILVIWFLTILNFYLCVKLLQYYAKSAGLNKTPVVLDTLTYYTPDEGYENLSVLGKNGRHAYRLMNYADFVLPILLFLSLSLPNLAMGKGHQYATAPFLYMISDYIENVAEKYVLEIYPKRHDSVMRLACYAGVVKMLFVSASILILIVTSWKHLFVSNDQKQKSK